MMIDGYTLTEAIKSGQWKAYIEEKAATVEELNIGTNSVNLTLGARLIAQYKVETGKVIDPVDDPESLKWYDLPAGSDGKYILFPGDFCLGYARERFEAHEPLWIEHEGGEPLRIAPNIMHNKIHRMKMYFVPMFEGRSTVGRLGLAMHITAGFGDYGFSSNFTMEINNVSPNPLVLTPGMQVAQLHFESVTPNVHKMFYKGAYAGKNGGPHPPVLGRSRFFK